MQISYEMVSNVHVRQLTVPFKLIGLEGHLIPRGIITW